MSLCCCATSCCPCQPVLPALLILPGPWCPATLASGDDPCPSAYCCQHGMPCPSLPCSPTQCSSGPALVVQCVQGMKQLGEQCHSACEQSRSRVRCSNCLFSPPSKLYSQPCCSQECQQLLSNVPTAVPSSHGPWAPCLGPGRN